jgi:hypothetical protein
VISTAALAHLRALAVGWIPPAVVESARVEDSRRAYEQLLARLGITPESLQPPIERAPLTAADFPGCAPMLWRKRARR